MTIAGELPASSSSRSESKDSATGLAATSSSNTAVSKRSDKQFDGAAILASLAMTVFELGFTLTASYLVSKWIANMIVVKNNRAGGFGGGEDDMDNGLYSPNNSNHLSSAGDGDGSSNGIVIKLKRLLEARQESTMSAMMEELDNDDDNDCGFDKSNFDSPHPLEEEKKEDFFDTEHRRGDANQAGDKNEKGTVVVPVASSTLLPQRQQHIQRLQFELQSRHISSLHSLNSLTPYELSIARNNLIDPSEISVSFADVGGMDDIKSEIYDLVVLPLLRPDLFDCESGLVDPPKGILLYGPPGTGKTMLAKAIAKESHATFINVQLSTIMNKWFGESNKLVAATFQLAKKLAPSVVFIDEIDAFLSQRDGTEGSAMSSMKSEFLTLWDGLLSERRRGRSALVINEKNGKKLVTQESENGSSDRRRRGFSFFGRNDDESKLSNEEGFIPLHDKSSLLPPPGVIVLGATNRPYDVDPAILRRLPRSFEIPLPPLQSRLQLLQLFLMKQSMTKEATEFLPELAQRTEGYSGSDLKEVCRAAAWEPVREMTTGASRIAVGVGSVRRSNNEGGSSTNEGNISTPVLKRTSSGFPPRGTKARPVNVHDFLLAIQKVKRTGESARQFHAKEFIRAREDRSSMVAEISRADANNQGKTTVAKSDCPNDNHLQNNGNRVQSVDVDKMDVQQLMAIAMAAVASMKVGDENANVNSTISCFDRGMEGNDDENFPPEMTDAVGG